MQQVWPFSLDVPGGACPPHAQQSGPGVSRGSNPHQSPADIERPPGIPHLVTRRRAALLAGMLVIFALALIAAAIHLSAL